MDWKNFKEFILNLFIKLFCNVKNHRKYSFSLIKGDFWIVPTGQAPSHKDILEKDMILFDKLGIVVNRDDLFTAVGYEEFLRLNIPELLPRFLPVRLLLGKNEGESVQLYHTSKFVDPRIELVAAQRQSPYNEYDFRETLIMLS